MSRKIEQYPDKAIRPILLSIVESLESWRVFIADMREDYENEFQQSYPIIKSELESYGLENEFEDVTYIMYLFINNPNFTTEPIKRPELKKYEILHIVDRTIPPSKKLWGRIRGPTPNSKFTDVNKALYFGSIIMRFKMNIN